MEKEFVPYNEAKELRDLGFNEECFGYYPPLKKELVIWHNPEITSKGEFVLAPLYQQAFKWFREKHKLFAETPMCIPQEGVLNGCYVYTSIIKEAINYREVVVFEKGGFPTNSQAQLACLQKLIEIVKNAK